MMDATQQMEDPLFEEEEEEEEDKEGPKREQLATLKVFKNVHIPEAEFPLYVGENILGRDPAACSVLLPARSVSSLHAVISISVFHSSKRSDNGDAVEALIWDMGSLNGTRKGRLKLTPQVRYALTEGESVVLADVPCQYIGLDISKRDALETPEKGVCAKEEKESPVLPSSDPKLRKGVQNGLNDKEKIALPPVPLWSPEEEEPSICSPQSAHKQPEITLVPESDSDGESATDERKDFVSDSASSSNLCSSANSSFLTPAKKIIPESEDESSFTPSSASMNRFRLSESNGEPSSNSSKHGPLALNLDSGTDFEEEEMKKSKTELLATPELAARIEPAPSAEFHMDSDTDVEEEDAETGNAGPEARAAEKSVTSAGLLVDSDTEVESEPEAQIEQSPKVGPVSSADLHMDSDTDVEKEEEDKSKPDPVAQTETPKLETVSSADLHIDSDTDVEEEESDASKAKPEAHNAVTLDKPVSSPGLHIDSDTDVEEDEEQKSKTEQKAEIIKSVALTDLHMDSDTDVEEEEPDACSAKPEALDKSESSVGQLHMDSDTEVKDDNPVQVPQPIANIIDVRPTMSTPGTELNMDSDTDVDEENKEKTRDFLSNSETDDEDPFKPVERKVVEGQKASDGGGEGEQSVESILKKQDQHFEDDWDLLSTQAYGAVSTKRLDLEATQAFGTETDREEDQEEPLSHIQPYTNLSTAETQLIPVAKPGDYAEEEDEETPNDSHLSTADTVIIASTPRREEQTQAFSLFTAQTQLVWEGEGQEVDQSEPTQLIEADTNDEMQEGENEENIKQEMKTHGTGAVHNGKNSSSYLIIAETQPMCEDEEAIDLSGNDFQKPSTRKQVKKYDSSHCDKNIPSSHVTIAETQPMCDDEELPGQDDVLSSVQTEKHFSSHIATAETQPMFEEEEVQDDDLKTEVSRRQTDKDEPVHNTEEASTSYICIPKTQPACEENVRQELSSKTSTRRSCRGLSKKGKDVPQPDEAVVSHTMTEAQPNCVEEQAPDDNLKVEVSSGSISQQAGEFKSTELAETQPISDEKEAPGEDMSDAARTRQIDEDNSIEFQKPSSSYVNIAETQPVLEENEEQEKNFSNKTPSRRSCRGKLKKEDEVSQIAETSETQPIPEDLIERAELNSEFKSRRSRRTRIIKEDKVPQLADAVVGSVSTITEMLSVCEDGTERDEDLSLIRSDRSCRGRQIDEGEPPKSAGLDSGLTVVEAHRMFEENAQEEPSSRTSRRQRKDKAKEESAMPASSKAHVKSRKVQDGKRKRGKELSEDEVESEEEKIIRKGTRRTGLKQKCSEGEKVEERNAQEEKEKMKKEQVEKERVQKEENERKEQEEHEQEEHEERERAETQRQKLEQEQKEQLKREEDGKRGENDSIQRGKDEERLERERNEQEEHRQKEEERIKKEKEQKEKERLQAEKEQLEKERQENEARAQKDREEKNLKKGQKNKQLDKDKSELEPPLVPPARRSRRCSSSSLNSDQSATSQQEPSSQRGRTLGRGRGRGKQTVGEQPISARQSSRRGPAFEVKDTEQDSSLTTRSRSRSSSRSSERSANSVQSSNQGTRGRGRGRKSVNLPQPEEVSQAKPSGRGRGRRGRPSGVENVDVGMSNELKQDADMVEGNTAVPQINNRGRKRAANTSTTAEEAPSPTPKTPRRSLASQAHKVLFTGLTDESGERVVARLGGTLAKGVNDMTHLVTDKARRTVKFLCAVARGVPIVTPDWLKKCGRAGHFVAADEYILKDIEQEKKFDFCLEKSLQTAQSESLLKGYEIHVTPSVMPEPSQMKEIITCCGARFLPKMPSAHKAHVVVVSCEQDRGLCAKAVGMSLPVVSTEFLLTGILQQRVDLQAYSLTSSLDTSNQPPAPKKAAARSRRK